MNSIITFQNEGKLLLNSNYWDSEMAEKGLFFVSINAGEFRLLIPDNQKAVIPEMRTASSVIITKGAWPKMGKREAYEIMFEDDSDEPYTLHMTPDQFCTIPGEFDRDRPGQPARWTFSAYVRYGMVFNLPCRFRIAKKLPYMKPWPDA